MSGPSRVIPPGVGTGGCVRGSALAMGGWARENPTGQGGVWLIRVTSPALWMLSSVEALSTPCRLDNRTSLRRAPSSSAKANEGTRTPIVQGRNLPLFQLSYVGWLWAPRPYFLSHRKRQYTARAMAQSIPPPSRATSTSGAPTNAANPNTTNSTIIRTSGRHRRAHACDTPGIRLHVAPLPSRSIGSGRGPRAGTGRS